MNIEELIFRALNGRAPDSAPNMLAAPAYPDVRNFGLRVQAPERIGVPAPMPRPDIPQAAPAPAPMQQPVPLTQGQIRAFMPEERGSALAPTMPSGRLPAPSMGPTQSAQSAQPAPAQRAPAPRGGGIGGFLGNLLNPGAAGKNQTIGFLMQQGMSEGTANLVAGSKPLLQKYLYEKTLGKGSLFDQRARVAQQYGLTGKPAQEFILSGKLNDDEKNLINVGDGRLYDPNSGQWITAPNTGTKAPTVQTFYDENGLEYKGQWDERAQKWVQVGGSKAPSGGITVTSPEGTVMQVGGSGQKMTEGQSKDVVYYTLGTEANEKLADLQYHLTSFFQENAGMLPVGIGNYLRNPEFRQAKVLAERFLTAALRKETGAAVTETEWNKYGPMFLPVPGDDDKTIQTKERMREVTLLAIRSGLGTAEAIAQANRIALGLQPGTGQLTPAPGNGQDLDSLLEKYK